MLTERPQEQTQMTFGEHLDELRRRLWRAVIGVVLALGVTLWFGNEIIQFLTAPILDALRNAKLEPTLIALSVVDPMHILAPVTMGLFLAGAAFSYYAIVTVGVNFLVRWGVDMGVKIMPELDATITFVLMMSLVMGVIFQLPLVMIALVKIRICSVKTFRGGGHHADAGRCQPHPHLGAHARALRGRRPRLPDHRPQTQEGARRVAAGALELRTPAVQEKKDSRRGCPSLFQLFDTPSRKGHAHAWMSW